MRTSVFYVLLFLYPVVRLLLTLVIRLSWIFAVVLLLVDTIKGNWNRSIGLVTFFGIVSLLALVAKEKYVALLLDLQPEGTTYTFYS